MGWFSQDRAKTIQQKPATRCHIPYRNLQDQGVLLTQAASMALFVTKPPSGGTPLDPLQLTYDRLYANHTYIWPHPKPFFSQASRGRNCQGPWWCGEGGQLDGVPNFWSWTYGKDWFLVFEACKSPMMVEFIRKPCWRGHRVLNGICRWCHNRGKEVCGVGHAWSRFQCSFPTSFTRNVGRLVQKHGLPGLSQREVWTWGICSCIMYVLNSFFQIIIYRYFGLYLITHAKYIPNSSKRLWVYRCSHQVRSSSLGTFKKAAYEEEPWRWRISSSLQPKFYDLR